MCEWEFWLYSVCVQRVFVRCVGPACVQCMFVHYACFRHTTARIPDAFCSMFFCCACSVCVCAVCVCVFVCCLIFLHILWNVYAVVCRRSVFVYIYMYHVTLWSCQITHVNETWHTNYSVNVARQKRTFLCHTCEWVTSCHVYEWVVFVYIHMYHVTLLSCQVTHVNESWHTNHFTHSARQKRTFLCHTCEWVTSCHVYEWVMALKLFRPFCASKKNFLLSHMGMSQDMSHIWMSPWSQTIPPILRVGKRISSGTHGNESRRVTRMNESWHTDYSAHSAHHKRTFVCHTCEWAMPCHIYEWVLAHRLFSPFCASKKDFLLISAGADIFLDNLFYNAGTTGTDVSLIHTHI